MSITFTHYVGIRNNYCIAYFGLSHEYPILIKALRGQIQRRYPELRVFIACSDKLFFWIEDEQDVIKQSEVRDRLTEFAYMRQIETSADGDHPLWTLINESAIEIEPVKILPMQKNTGICLICPDGGFPTKPMLDVEKIKNMVNHRGYTPIVVGSDVNQVYKNPDKVPVNNGKLEILSTADWVVGVENEYLFSAGLRGIPVSLIPTGTGTNLFKALFKGGEILRV